MTMFRKIGIAASSGIARDRKTHCAAIRARDWVDPRRGIKRKAKVGGKKRGDAGARLPFTAREVSRDRGNFLPSRAIRRQRSQPASPDTRARFRIVPRAETLARLALGVPSHSALTGPPMDAGANAIR